MPKRKNKYTFGQCVDYIVHFQENSSSGKVNFCWNSYWQTEKRFTKLNIDCKQSVFLRIQVRASSQQKVWNEAEKRERDCGETLKIRFLSPHTYETRALRARKTRTPRFTNFFTDFEQKNDCLAV